MRATGHIRQRSLGSWEVRYTLGTNPATGKRRTATVTVKGTKSDAVKELRRLLHSLDTGEHVDPTRMTLAEWLRFWLSAVRDEVSPKSYERYSEIVTHFLIPELGALPVAKLAPPEANGRPAVAVTARKVDSRRGLVVIFTAS